MEARALPAVYSDLSSAFCRRQTSVPGVSRRVARGKGGPSDLAETIGHGSGLSFDLHDQLGLAVELTAAP